MATKVRPGIPTVPLSYSYYPFTYEGKIYRAKVNYDLNSPNFLKITEIQYGGIGNSNIVIYPTDAQNAPNAGPWGGPFSAVGGTGKAGTKLFNEVVNSAEANKGYGEELSAKYGSVSASVKKEWKKSANSAGTGNTLDKVVAGTPFTPNPNQGSIDTQTGIDPTTIKDSFTVPKEILELQETAEEEIKSLFPGTSDSQQRFLSYPVDGIYDNSQDSILIEMFTYRPPQESLLIDNKQISTGGNAITKVFSSGLTRNSNLRDFIGAVRLPIPQEISSSNEVDWGPKSANALEAGAFYSALGVSSTLLNDGPFKAIGQLGAIGTQLSNSVQGGQFGANTSMGLQLSSFLSALALGQMGINVDPNQFITRALGASINPNLELLFNGPKLRQFNFSFEFAPNGQTEATQVRRIIRLFNQGMAAKKNANNAIFLGSPNIFRLKYMNGADRIKGLNAFKICALLGCEVNYTAGGKYAAYADDLAVSQPARMTMKLSFQELTPIFDTDYTEKGQQDSSIQDLNLGRITEDDILF